MGGLALITHNADRLYMPNLLQPREAKLCTKECVPFSHNSRAKPSQQERGYEWKLLSRIIITTPDDQDRVHFHLGHSGGTAGGPVLDYSADHCAGIS